MNGRKVRDANVRKKRMPQRRKKRKRKRRKRKLEPDGWEDGLEVAPIMRRPAPILPVLRQRRHRRQHYSHHQTRPQQHISGSFLIVRCFPCVKQNYARNDRLLASRTSRRDYLVYREDYPNRGDILSVQFNGWSG